MSAWDWTLNAACRGKDIVLFYGPDGERGPEKAAREGRAKAVCARCPVRPECLGYAIERPERYGTWAGLNEEERSLERRRRTRARLAAQQRQQVAS